jgi:mannosyl-oligosaccharide alpha-1,2-mannosidase
MHEKVIEATKKYLLYRPMIKDSKRDILFSSKVYSRDGSDKDLTADFEITHLTCFLGGMFGLGGKLFNRAGDVEIAKKLADGCVWAYEVMPAGVMPEGAMIVPCQSTKKCEWNETLWYQKLDPNYKWRPQQIEDYHERLKDWKAKKAQLLSDYETKKKEYDAEQRRKKRPSKVPKPSHAETEPEEPSNLAEEDFEYRYGKAYPKKGAASTSAKENSSGSNDSSDILRNSASKGKKESTLDKREVGGEEPAKDMASSAIDKKERQLEEELDLNSHTNRGYRNMPTSDYDSDSQQQPLMEPIIPPEPIKPLTHEEYVAKRLKEENLPEGFQSLNDRRYLLRYVQSYTL